MLIATVFLAGRQEATALEEQVAKLRADCGALQNRKDALTRSVEGLSSQKGYLMGESNGATVSLEAATQAQQHYLAQVRISDCAQSNLHTNLKSGPHSSTSKASSCGP
jgi:peptidoglycan hydrolase CwlO-like protein